MTRKRIGILLGVALAAIGLVFASAASRARDSSFAEVMRGRYLVYAGDCAACHTTDNGEPFAGGRAVPTPFGTIYATNITPDRTTGIGSWTEDDFWNAMHSGRRPDGSHLYPAFPYPWFTKLGRGDVIAIKAYLDTLAPVKQENKAPDLPWPLSWRASVAGWNTLFFKPGTFTWNASKSEQWNRGAYLVEGLGHCGACHSPKNTLGAVKTRDAFEGGSGEGWFATSLRPGTPEGLGRWSENDIVEYLKTGANAHARAMGPMAEVVHNSTMHLRDDDLHAIAVYLRDLPADSGTGTPATADQAAVERGRLVYVDQCAGCHMENGAGIAGVFPPIKGNAGVHAHDATSLARLVLEGARSATTPQKPEGFAMPGFEDKLTDREIADLLTYIRASFGNAAAPVSESKVADVRASIHAEGE